MSEGGAVRLGPTRAEVLDHLRTTGGPVDVAEVSAAVGFHPNTTRFHLDALVEAGLVARETEARRRPGRPRVLYRAAPGHRANRYQDLAAAMVRHFAGAVEDRGAHAVLAGEAWGAELRAEQERAGALPPLERVVGSLDALGYAPTLLPGPDTVVQLRPCPYLDLADDDPEVVCQLHLGLVRGLIGPGEGWTVTAIEPWATPATCLVRLAPVPEVAAADA